MGLVRGCGRCRKRAGGIRVKNESLEHIPVCRMLQAFYLSWFIIAWQQVKNWKNGNSVTNVTGRMTHGIYSQVIPFSIMDLSGK